MGTEPVIVDISSGEEDDWLSDLLGRVNEDVNDFDDVVLLDEEVGYASKIQKQKYVRSNGAKGSGSDSDDDCQILDGDPDKPVAVVDDAGNGADDLLIVGEKGHLACRDYPHPRHLCAKFPFNTTPHEKHCDLCHCYVCDLRAPCIHWGTGVSSTDHCHSTDKEEIWRGQRQRAKKGNIAVAHSQEIPSLPISGPVLPSHGSLSTGLSNPLQSSVSNSIHLPPFSVGFDGPNIVRPRPIRHPRPFPLTNPPPLYLNDSQQPEYRRPLTNRERIGGSTVGLQPVASHQKFKRPGYPGISSMTVNQSGFGLSNSLRTYVPAQGRFQNEQVTQTEYMDSWKGLLASVDSSELGAFNDSSQVLYGNSNVTDTQLHAEPQVFDQPLPRLNENQNANQCGNPTTSVTDSDLLDDFSWLNATSNSIPQQMSASDAIPPSVQSSVSSAVSQHHLTSPDSWMPSPDHQPVPGLFHDSLLSGLEFDPPEAVVFDPAMILFELGITTNGV